MGRRAPSRPSASAQDDEPGQQHGRNSADVEQDLANLRLLWGGSYRITWAGQFRATDIATSEAVIASTAAELRALLTAARPKGLL